MPSGACRQGQGKEVCQRRRGGLWVWTPLVAQVLHCRGHSALTWGPMTLWPLWGKRHRLEAHT